MIGLVGTLFIHSVYSYLNKPVVYHAEASEPNATGTPVMIEVVVDWNEARVEEEIRRTFPEAPNTAVAIAKCESGLDPDIQSHHVRGGIREESFGVMQIHSPSWDKVARRLGYDEYRTNPADNIKMARYIYDNAGQTFNDWSCYTKGMYKAKL